MSRQVRLVKPLAKHRPAADGGYQCGEETRTRIVAAAVELFGERGFEGITTRDIAARAGINSPVLQYYFDGKAGLYLVCLKYVIAQFWALMGDVVEQAESALARRSSATELIEAFCRVQMQWAELSCVEKTIGWRGFFQRQQADLGPSFALDAYYDGINRRMFAVMIAIVARLLNTSTENPEALIRALALNGQLAILHSMPRTTLSVLKREHIGPEEVALFKNVVREHTSVMLRSIAQMHVSNPTRSH